MEFVEPPALFTAGGVRPRGFASDPGRAILGGEELLIRDRSTTIAKIVPLALTEGASAEEVALAAEGKVRLPGKRLSASFWKTSGPRVGTDRALEILRDDRDAR